MKAKNPEQRNWTKPLPFLPPEPSGVVGQRSRIIHTAYRLDNFLKEYYLSPNKKKILIVLLLMVLTTLGCGISYWSGARVEKSAQEVWLAKGRVDAARMTENILFWIAKAQVNLRAIAGQLRGQEDLNNIKFRDLVIASKAWDPEVDFDSVAYARRVSRDIRPDYEKAQGAQLKTIGKPGDPAPNVYESFAILYSSTDVDYLQRHGDLMSHPSMRQVVMTARQLPGDVVLGPSFIGKNKDQFSLVATSVDLQGSAGVMVATINLSQFFENLSGLYLPDDILVRLSERDNEASATSKLTPVIGAKTAPADAVATEIIRVASGQAKWELHWDIMPGYQGGPADKSALLIKIGGSILTLLIVFTVGFLAFRNLLFHHLVQERTAQLSQNSMIIQLTMDSIDQGFSVWNADHRLLVWSKRCLDFWYNPGDLIHTGMHMKVLLAHLARQSAFGDGDPEVLAEKEFIRIISDGRVSEDEFAMTTGQTVNVRRFSLDNGGHVGVYTDITERIKAEKEIRESVDRYRELSDLSSDWVWEMDANLRFSYFSVGFRKVNGIDPGFALGKTRQEVTTDDLDSEHWKNYISNLENRREFRYFRYTFVGPDGTEQQHSVSGQPIFDGAGVFIGYRGTSSNVTALFDARKLLVDAKQKAEEANRIKSEFLSSMSHELRTPLNAILGFGQMLELNQDEPLTADQKFSVDHIKNGGTHLLTLIDDILDLSKIETGNIDLSIEPVFPRDVFKECLELSRGLATSKGISLEGKQETKYGLMADYNRLKQVLLNLLTNAIKYNQDAGSVTFGCVDQPNEIVRIYVSDTGYGISDEKLSELFTPFNRLGMEASEIEGTGIGLTISKRLVEQMGGKIGCDSKLGLGSTFWLDFPRSESAPETALLAEADSGPNPETDRPVVPVSMAGTILYIEDNPTNRDLMKMILGRIGNLDLHTALTAETGITMTEKILPDLILMDINLPGMSGTEALQVLRSMSTTKDIPVIAISANAMVHDIRAAMKSGFDEYITKPFDIPDVMATISNVLAGRSKAAGSTNGSVGSVASNSSAASQYRPLAAQDVSRILTAAQILPASYRAVLESQANALPTLIADIGQAALGLELPTVESLAHKLKTNSGTFGARKLWSLAQKVEDGARDRQPADIADLVAAMEQEYQTVSPMITRLLTDLQVDTDIPK